MTDYWGPGFRVVFGFFCRGRADNLLRLALQVGAHVSNLHLATYLGTERLPASIGEFWYLPCSVEGSMLSCGTGERAEPDSRVGSTLELFVRPGRLV